VLSGKREAMTRAIVTLRWRLRTAASAVSPPVRWSSSHSFTDFRTLVPDFPVRLGALGALLVIATVLIAGGGAETRRQGLCLTALRLASSALLGAAAAWMSPDADTAQVVLFCAVAVAGVLAIGLMVDTLRALFESRAPGHPQFRGGRPQRERGINCSSNRRATPYSRALDVTVKATLLLTIPRCCALSCQRSAFCAIAKRPGDWRRRIRRSSVSASLMAANSATHLMILSHDPIDIIVTAVPVISADPTTETALEPVHRLLALAPEVAG
jgi:hypothetical protein